MVDRGFEFRCHRLDRVSKLTGENSVVAPLISQALPGNLMWFDVDDAWGHHKTFIISGMGIFWFCSCDSVKIFHELHQTITSRTDDVANSVSPQTKKADVMTHPELSQHVGLLTNSPPSPAGLRFIQSSD